ncbi:MAG: OmpH family outer membrane protein, partial [Methylomarinum sp.]|nr:OmpH family outer membrane protein [Methylomarinum sp.]
LQRRILEAVRALAKDEKYDLLLTDGVIYNSQKIDVTEQVQKKLSSLSD